MKILEDFKKNTLYFLENQKSKKKDGYFKYSYSWDIYDEDDKRGLWSSIFASKIYYAINEIKNINPTYKKNWIKFINSFSEKKYWYIYDPLIFKKSKLFNRLVCIKNFHFQNRNGNEYKRAETRQARAALLCLWGKPKYPYKNIPSQKDWIIKYIKDLNRKNPRSAWSHISHLLFFLYNNQKIFWHKNQELINIAIKTIKEYEHKEDWAWYKYKNTDNQLKINWAMKIITGLNSCDKINISYPKKLIDLTLKTLNDQEACSNFNITYTLYNASKETKHKYRFDEIKIFMESRLDIYKKHYKIKERWFSFYRNKSNNNYYWAKITNQKNEADIHGTLLFIRGLSFIDKILSKKLNLNEIIT